MRLLIADTDNQFRVRLRSTLRRIPDITSTEEFDDHESLISGESEGGSDLLLISDALAGLPPGGIAALVQANLSRPVIVLGADDTERLRAMLREGARGYVRRGLVAEELPHAIAVVMSNGIYVPPLLGMRASTESLMTQAGPIPVGMFREDGAQQLTPRQREVLSMIRSDWGNSEIADAMGVTVGTVKIHVTAIFKALGVQNRTQAKIAAECLNVPMMKRLH